MPVTQSGKSRSTVRKSPPAVTARKPRKTSAKAAALAISSEEWQSMVATAAYLRAEARGFVGGSAEEDWLEAEKEIAARLAEA